MNPIWTLAPVSIALGAALMWIFRRTTDRGALRETIRHIQAHLLEFWLFVDEPRLIGKSWKGLLLANVRLYRLIWLPLLIVSVPMLPVWFGLDTLYGSSLLPTGKPAIVTMTFHHQVDQTSLIPELNAPDGISVESPAVRVFSQRQVSWRVRPRHSLAGEFRWVIDGRNFGKTVAAGEGFRFHSQKRTGSFLELVRHPLEPMLPAGPIDWIGIEYPPATVRLLGIDLHWSIWFVAFSLMGAVLSAGT